MPILISTVYLIFLWSPIIIELNQLKNLTVEVLLLRSSADLFLVGSLLADRDAIVL